MGESAAPLKAVLVQEHGVTRYWMKDWLERNFAMKVAAESKDGDGVNRLIRRHKPCLLLMDIDLARGDGFDILGTLSREFPRLKTVILSAQHTQEHARRALDYGVNGYVLKQGPIGALEAAVTTVMGGGTYFSPEISRTVADLANQKGRPADPAPSITGRQQEILKLTARGFSAGQIAKTLKLSKRTVETHKYLLMKKLKVCKIIDLVRYAFKKRIEKI